MSLLLMGRGDRVAPRAKTPVVTGAGSSRPRQKLYLTTCSKAVLGGNPRLA